jgi:acetyl esterase/lipase
MRLPIATLLLTTVCCGRCYAEPATRPAATQAVATLAGIQVERNIPYVPNGDPAEVLDLYLPTTASANPLPLIVWIHGGGWWAGSKAGCPPAKWVRDGYAAASVEYRFSRKAVFPAQIQDCQAAIRWLRANSAKYNIDPDHIGVWGGSAGGHLVALLGTSGGKHAFAPIGGNEDTSDRVQAVCDFFGPADFNTVMSQVTADKTVKNIFKFNTPGDPYSTLIGVHLGSDEEKGAAVSPVHYVSSDNPPFLIMHGTADTLVPFAQSVELRDALQKAGVEVILQRFPGSGHGGPAFSLPVVLKLIKTFFDKHLKQEDVKVDLLPDSTVAMPASTPHLPQTK